MSVLANRCIGGKPRLGFAGLGWIGSQRMKVVAESGLAEIAAVCEPNQRSLDKACESLESEPTVCSSYDELILEPLDGIVIATPNTLHEPQAVLAMLRGLPVFSQKPLAISSRGTRRLLQLAQQRRLPLGVDLSYRHLAGMPELRARLQAGEIGDIVAVELAFHNAYGPDADWYYDMDRAGGGCLLDLGCHLLDLCHWLVGARTPTRVQSMCSRNGRRLPKPVSEPEDFAVADIEYQSGTHVHLSCSWRASVGCGAIISARLFGTKGGAELRNVDGSFYDFEIALHRGTDRNVLAAPPDSWSGRALLAWAQALRDQNAIVGDDGHLAATANLIDRIYGRACETLAS
jgi:predicted dehydrogenase